MTIKTHDPVSIDGFPSDATHPARWTSLNIGLHWLIAGLIVVQAIDAQWIPALFDASVEGKAVGGVAFTMGWMHMLTGGLIFLAIALRLWDRFAHGRPPYPADEPNWAQRIAKASHGGLYALLLAMPVAGLATWITKSETIASVHTWAWSALLTLIGLHVAGTLANRYWFHSRTDVLRRMMPGQGRNRSNAPRT